MTVALGQLALKEAGVEPQPRARRAPLIALAAVLALVVVAALVFNRPLQAAWYTNLGALDETRAMLAPNLSDTERNALYDTARAQYQRALALDPLWAGANRRLGNLERHSFEFATAVPLLEQAYALDPDHPSATKGLGMAYAWAGQIDEAVATFRRLGEDSAVSSELYTWGYFFQDRDMPLQSAYVWETAVKLDDSQQLDVWNLVAEAYGSAGDTQHARDWFERVLAIEPDNNRAIQGLATLADDA
jgi:tetratricopeptide (TPR) repeat protein